MRNFSQSNTNYFHNQTLSFKILAASIAISQTLQMHCIHQNVFLGVRFENMVWGLYMKAGSICLVNMVCLGLSFRVCVHPFVFFLRFWFWYHMQLNVDLEDGNT